MSERQTTLARAVAEHLLSDPRQPSVESPEPTPPLEDLGVDIGRARLMLRLYDGISQIQQAAAGVLAKDLDAPDEADELGRTLLSAYRVLLAHPGAAKAGFAALVAEGRAYARTAEGQQLRARLLRSSRMRRASLLLRSIGMGMLSVEYEGALPSAYLDNLMGIVDDRAGRDTIVEFLRKLGGPA